MIKLKQKLMLTQGWSFTAGEVWSHKNVKGGL